MNCNQCGTCCKLFLINLTKEEYNSKSYKTQFDEHVNDFQEAELTGANILETKNQTECIYLKDKKCSIHKNRPQSCRNFFCKSDNPKFKKMIEAINAQSTKTTK